MSFGDVVRSASAPCSGPQDIGGNSDTIWMGAHVAFPALHRIYELSTTDFSSVRYDDIATNYPLGMGGDSDTIWSCTNVAAGLIIEYSTSDLSEVRNDSSPDTGPSGCGGNADVIWHCDDTGDDNYELDPSDFSTVAGLACPDSTTTPVGIGGGPTHVWQADYGTSALYELNNSLGKIQSASLPTASSRGVGGDDSVIWHCTLEPKVYELDSEYTSPADLSFVSICFIG